MSNDCYDNKYGSFRYGDRNSGGVFLLVFDLVIINLCFDKKDEYLVVFKSVVGRIQIE